MLTLAFCFVIFAVWRDIDGPIVSALERYLIATEIRERPGVTEEFPDGALDRSEPSGTVADK